MQVPQDADRVARVGWAALALSLVCLVIGSAGYEVSWPPEFKTEWVFTTFMIGFTLCFCGFAGRITDNPLNRFLIGLAMVFALLAGVPSLYGYFGNATDYPWISLTCIGMLLTAASLTAKIYPPLVLAAGAVCIWLPPLLRSPSTSFPRTLVAQGLNVKLLFQQRLGMKTMFALDVKGSSKEFALDHIQAVAHMGPMTPLQCRVQDKFPTDSWIPPYRHVMELSVPRWAKTWDARVTIPKWPVPAVSITISTSRPNPQRRWQAQKGKYRLTISDMKLTTSEPPDLDCTVAFAGFSYGGSKGLELRVVDQNGHDVPFESRSEEGSQSGALMPIEISPAPGKKLTLQLLPEGWQNHGAVFNFERLPNPLQTF
jgi:hypothetical protein